MMTNWFKPLHIVPRSLAAAAAASMALLACEAETAVSADVDMSAPPAAAGTDFLDGYKETDEGWVTGAQDAPVKLVEYASFTCGGCGGFFARIYPQLKANYIDTGLVQFEFRSYIRTNPDLLATMIADCLGEEKFEGLKTLYFSSQPKWLTSPNPDDYVAKMARKAGVSNARFRQCTSDAMVRTEIVEQTKQATKTWGENGNFSTPTVIVDDRKVSDGLDYELIKTAIETALRS